MRRVFQRPNLGPAALVVAALAASGCGLILDLSPPDVPPTVGSIYRCEAVVRSTAGFERTVSTDDPEFVERVLFSCSSGCGACDGVDPAGLWDSYLPERIDAVATGPLGSEPSDFRLWPGPWCLVEQRGCVPVMAIPETGPPVCATPLPSASPLGACPPSTPEEFCVDVSPTSIDFPDAPACGTEGPSPVRISNCGTVPLRIVVADSAADPGGGPSPHFQVNLGSCAPSPEEILRMDDRTLLVGAGCDASVLYSPAVRGRHTAELVIASDARAVRLPLGGNALGGTSEVATGDLCFERPAAGACTPPQTVTLANSGPGCLEVQRVEIVRGGPDFERVDLPGMPLPARPFVLADRASQDVGVRFCERGGGVGEGVLEITTDDTDPARTTRRLNLRVQASCP